MAKLPAAPAYLAARLGRLREALAKTAGGKEGGAYLVTSFVDVSWLTGFEGDDSYVLVTPDKKGGGVVLISDSRYEEQIQSESPWVEMVIRRKGMPDEVAKQVKRLGIQKLRVQSESMTLRGRQMLEEKMKEKGGRIKVAPVADVIVKLRHIKDSQEIAILEKAIEISEGAFLAMKGQLKAGMTENEIAGLLGYEMRKRGAINSSFDSIVAVGANGSLPHYRPGETKLTANSPLLVDWGARYRGYCADLTRVVFFGNVPAKIREIYQIVLEAQLAGIAAIRPGVAMKKVDQAARDVIAKAGYGKQFGHGTGHGIGREIHEALSFSKLSKAVCEEGMVMTVEPGIYLPGIGGVRIEDDVVVTKEGCRVMSSLAKKIESCGNG
ncbi:MAG: aminopeptidase P family protein [Phycisphaerales bacterium]|nr:aminopeptidase P family protein [Phycisphaerales bacterium]